ncbi:MAG: hypothetical protein HY299_19775 [Verrucomicrobia bacterium]|nr:hypothetical protein [Verrucomicrobiota bacterium]
MTNPYRPLSGKSSGLGGSYRLFAGPDHLLLVTANGFREEYRRFYFADIQAFAWRRTVTGLVLSLGLAILVLCGVAMAVAVPESELSAGLTAGLLLLVLVVNLFRGATCSFVLVTSGRTHRVPALARVRDVRRFISQARPLAVAAQPIPAAPPAEAPVAESPAVMDAVPPPTEAPSPPAASA